MFPAFSRPTSLRFARSAAAAFALACCLAHSPAGALEEHQPVIIDIAGPVTAGEPLPCAIQLTGGPARVTVYSDPPGAVSFRGTVQSPSATINAATAPNIDADAVTLYLVTDGQSVATATVETGPADVEIPR